MREVVVHLPPHQRDLLGDRGREGRIAVRLEPLGFVRQHGQRRLQSMGEVARFRGRPRERLLVVGQQRVEIVDERLHLGRIRAVKPRLDAFLHVGQPPADVVDRQERPAHHREADRHAAHRDDHRDRAVCVERSSSVPDLALYRHDDRGDGDEAERPQDGAQQKPAAQGAHVGASSAATRYPRPRTVSMTPVPSFRRSRATKTSMVFESRSALIE